jgi:hypothetical protein
MERIHVEVLMARHGQDLERAALVHRRSKGLPGRVLQQMQPALEAASLDQSQLSILDATSAGPVRLPELARRLGLGEHQLVDIAEPLLDRGLLVEIDDGAALSATKEGQHPNFSSR